MPDRIVHVEPEAPAKPFPGESCNGCGLCCLLEPCPLGVLLSRRRTGACTALRWDGDARQYRCGAMMAPAEVVDSFMPAGLRWMSPAGTAFLKRMAARWIAAGQGCDSWLDVSDVTVAGDGGGETDRQSLS